MSSGTPTSSGTRGSIFLETARVISQLAYEAQQFVLRVAAARRRARRARQLAHITCDATIPMRRPLSIMRDAKAGWRIELLYKVEGAGLRALAAGGL